MGRESAFLIVLLIILLVSLSSAIEVQSVKASETIYIRANGSIDPPTANMTTSDNVTYVFTDNIFDSTVVVEKNDIVVDGAGYTLQGTMHIHESTIGINMSGRTNVTVRNMQIRNFSVGIILSGSSNNTLSGNNMTDCPYGITLSSSTGNSISGNNITGNDFYRGGSHGIYLDSSSYNSISGNYVANNSNCGISVVGSSNYNSLSANNMKENVVGILLGSSNNSVSGNMFTGDGLLVGSYSNSVENNTVNGKPLVYLTDVKDYSVGEAGQVILVNCDNIKVENLDLSSTSTGVQLLGTNNTIISGNNMTANFYGILLGRSSNNSLSRNSFASCESCIHLDGSFDNYICENNMTASTNGITLSTSSNHNIISENTIANNQHGIELEDSSYNSIARNNITANNGYGIFLDGASNNSVSVNNLVDNDFGIYLYLALDNVICHNNFENARQVIASESEFLYANVWDDGYPSGGNYWSDYNRTDANHDGIGDTPYVIDANNTDNYPLMGTFYEFTVTDGMLYNIATVSNFTILDLYSLHELRLDGSWYLVLEISAVLPKGTVGFCRIDIPRVLIDGPYRVFTLGGNFTPTELPISNSSHALLYFTFDHSGPVIIVPEFPSFLILPLFFMATLLAVTVYRRKHR